MGVGRGRGVCIVHTIVEMVTVTVSDTVDYSIIKPLRTWVFANILQRPGIIISYFLE